MFALDPSSLPYVFWFPFFTPFGVLVARFFRDSPQSEPSLLIVGSGWLYYAVLTFWGLRRKRRRSFFLVYVILCLSLLLNGYGCQVLLHLKM